MENVEYYFEPESIAVVGASTDPDKPGYTLAKNVRDSFDGDVYPVNPSQDEILGMPCYDSISSVPGDVDLVSILIPAPHVPGVMEECAEKGVKAAFVGSEGFADVGNVELQEEVVGIAEDAGIRVWGPNCGGYISSDPDISNNFIMDTEGHIAEHLNGNVSFIAQSGMIAGGIYVEVITEDILDISKTLTIGNRADVAEADILAYLKDDADTDVVGIYQESVKKGREFREQLADISPEKPIVVLKGGRSEEGARAAQSHTGSIAGDDRVADGVFKQYGVTRVDDFRGLLNQSKGFSMYPDGIGGNNIALLTMTGAGSVVAADLFADHGLEYADLADGTLERLDEVYPDWMEPGNPVDIWLSITQLGIDRVLTHCLEVLLDDDNVDGVLLQSLAFDYFHDFDFDAFTAIAESSDKPVVTWLVGEKDHTPYWTEELEAGDIPVYRDLSSCARFLGAANRYAEWRRRRDGSGATGPDPDRAAAIRDRVDELAGGRGTLTEAAAKRVLDEWGIPVTEERVAADADAAVEAADAIGYPVALKVSSPDILHKSEAGGISLDLADADAVRAAYGEVVSNAREYDPDAEIEGVLVSEMVSEGREVIVGVNDDPEFGPVVLFGLGGVFVEVLEDVAIRAAPLSEVDAREMIAEIEGGAVLEGVRGGAPADVDAIVDVLQSVSRLAVALEDDLAEMDVNPLVVGDEGEGVVAADALLRLDR